MARYTLALTLLLTLLLSAQSKDPKLLLEYLGSTDGIDFFVHRTQYLDWNEARALCGTAGLRLAKITSAEQHHWLASALRGHAAYRYYWTAARDARTEEQLLWDDNNVTVTRFGTNVGRAEIRTAAAFYVSGSGSAIFVLDPASHPNYVLCEIEVEPGARARLEKGLASTIVTPEALVKPVSERGGISRENPVLVYLGTVDGTGFYADWTATRNWEDAKNLCAASGLRLAKIVSIRQHNWLAAALAVASDSSYLWYWTGARDAQTERQLLWDDTAEPVTRFGDDVRRGEIRTAATFYVPSALPGTAFLVLESINSLNNVLCETK